MTSQSHKLLLLAIALQTATPMLHANVAPFVQWRSEGRDTARKLVGTTSHHVYLYDMESFYGTFNMTPQYDQTFRAHELIKCLFGDSLVGSTTGNQCDDGGESIIISGTQNSDGTNNTTRAATEWMAENFYLPRNFKSIITFSPRVQNFLVDFNLYVGLDEWVKGLYFRIYGPVVNNRVTLSPCENITQEGTVSYQPGFFSTTEVPSDTLLQSALSFFSGCATITVPGITAFPLTKAKIADEKKSTTGFAELRGELGWNYLHEDYHFGFNVQAAAPTGKRPHGEFAFETQVGNGKHWELGVGLGAHWTMWRSEDDERHLDFVFEGDVTHLFNATQTRTFDLIGKPNSRYMLAEKMNLKPTTNLFGNTAEGGIVGGTQATSQFNAEYSPVANFSTRDVNVSIGVQGDIVAMINYTSRGISWDLGYNYWGMSHEHIELRDCDSAPMFPGNTWALKGDAQTYGYALIGGVQTPVPLSGTESLATIHQGTNIPRATTTVGANTNVGIDNAQFAQIDSAGTTIITVSPTSPIQIKTSIQPIFITVDNLNLEGAETHGSSNKLFTHLSYTWIDREDWIPYLGIGCYAEFGNTGNDHNENDSNTPCGDSSGVNCALSKWAVLVKGGVSFD